MRGMSNEYQPSRDDAYGEELYDKYGREHDEHASALVDLENGTRAYWADRLREFASEHATTMAGHRVFDVDVLLDLLDPYSGADGTDGAFRRTVLEGDEGYQSPTP